MGIFTIRKVLKVSVKCTTLCVCVCSLVRPCDIAVTACIISHSLLPPTSVSPCLNSTSLKLSLYFFQQTLYMTFMLRLSRRVCTVWTLYLAFHISPFSQHYSCVCRPALLELINEILHLYSEQQQQVKAA